MGAPREISGGASLTLATALRPSNGGNFDVNCRRLQLVSQKLAIKGLISSKRS